MVSVLSVEPWGMKQRLPFALCHISGRFSALGRAVGDETKIRLCRWGLREIVSVLSVEPWGMKPCASARKCLHT